MANVKGLVVQIGGDTSGLAKAINAASKGTKQLQDELKEVNKMLKFDPNSTILLTQKQQVLGLKIKDNEEKLKGLKSAQEEFIKNGGDLNTAEYRKLERQIAQTTEELKKLHYENSQWKTASDNLQKFSDTLTKVGGKITEIGQSLTRNVTLPIAGVLTAGVTLNAELEKTQKSFETFLGSAEGASEAVSQIREDASGSLFNTQSLLKANQMLISTGRSAEDSRKTIMALANAVTATGGGNDELVRMASNLQQISNARKSNINGHKTICICWN